MQFQDVISWHILDVYFTVTGSRTAVKGVTEFSRIIQNVTVPMHN
jgi:hypothetical protein